MRASGDAHHEVQPEQAGARLRRVRGSSHSGRGCRHLTVAHVRVDTLTIGVVPVLSRCARVRLYSHSWRGCRHWAVVRGSSMPWRSRRHWAALHVCGGLLCLTQPPALNRFARVLGSSMLGAAAGIAPVCALARTIYAMRCSQQTDTGTQLISDVTRKAMVVR